jgi:hypothetical protein
VRVHLGEQSHLLAVVVVDIDAAQSLVAAASFLTSFEFYKGAKKGFW